MTATVAVIAHCAEKMKLEIDVRVGLADLRLALALALLASSLNASRGNH